MAEDSITSRNVKAKVASNSSLFPQIPTNTNANTQDTSYISHRHGYGRPPSGQPTELSDEGVPSIEMETPER